MMGRFLKKEKALSPNRIVLEVEPNQIVARVSKRGYDSAEMAMAEQVIPPALRFALTGKRP